MNENSPGLDGINANRNSGSEVRVDEEGYIIRDPVSAVSGDQRKEVDNFYSDSDSSDEEEHKKPIHVIIKPISGQNDVRNMESIAELKQTVKSLSISPSQVAPVNICFLLLFSLLVSCL